MVSTAAVPLAQLIRRSAPGQAATCGTARSRRLPLQRGIPHKRQRRLRRWHSAPVGSSGANCTAVGDQPPRLTVPAAWALPRADRPTASHPCGVAQGGRSRAPRSSSTPAKAGQMRPQALRHSGRCSSGFGSAPHRPLPPQKRLEPISKAGAADTCSEQRRDNAEPWPTFLSSWPEAREGRWAKSHEHFLSWALQPIFWQLAVHSGAPPVMLQESPARTWRQEAG